jgi:CRP-like cAMP-binding protein
MVEYNAELHACCLPFLEEREAKSLLSITSSVSFAAGEQLYSRGASAGAMYFLVTGKIAVQNKTGFGDRSQVIALLDPGAPVGEGGLLGDVTRGATLTAVNYCELISLSREAFDTIVDESPVLAVKLLKWLLSRVSLRLKKNSERLAHVL